MNAVNGTEIWVNAYMDGDDFSVPGTLQFTGTASGMPDAQQWYIMMSTEDTMVAYYYGEVLTWHYEGFLVLSRSYELNPEREAEIAKFMEELGITSDEMCYLNPADDCKNLPSEQFEFLQ